MDNYKDFVVDTDGDLIIENGRFKIGPSTGQEVKTIMLSNQGNWKQSPLTGVGLSAYYNAPFTLKDRNSLARKIRLQLELDGLKVGKVEIIAFDNIKIDVTRG